MSARAGEVFANQEKALQWLSSPNPSLAGLHPSKLLEQIKAIKKSKTSLPANWQALSVAEQSGDEWVQSLRSAVLLVPSVVTGETNLLINPAHRDFEEIKLLEPIPVRF